MAAIHLLSFVGSWNAGGWAADYDLLERARKIGSLEAFIDAFSFFSFSAHKY